MKKNLFPEKPTSKFTTEQILQRNEILSEEVKHITFDDIKNSSELIEAFSKVVFKLVKSELGQNFTKRNLKGKQQ